MLLDTTNYISKISVSLVKCWNNISHVIMFAHTNTFQNNCRKGFFCHSLVVTVGYQVPIFVSWLQ